MQVHASESQACAEEQGDLEVVSLPNPELTPWPRCLLPSVARQVQPLRLAWWIPTLSQAARPRPGPEHHCLQSWTLHASKVGGLNG